MIMQTVGTFSCHMCGKVCLYTGYVYSTILLVI